MVTDDYQYTNKTCQCVAIAGIEALDNLWTKYQLKILGVIISPNVVLKLGVWILKILGKLVAKGPYILGPNVL